MKEYLASFDNHVLGLVNGFAKRWDFLDQIFIHADYYGVYAAIGLLVVMLVRKRRLFWSAFLSAVLSRFVLVEGIRWFYKRARPGSVMEEIKALVNVSAPAFPSGHTAFYFAVAAAFYPAPSRIPRSLLRG